ncbi:peptide ligase PGM1-related protein [Catenulispora yoronensis]
MSSLVIGNRLPGPFAHRVVWFARSGDVVVLPSHPTGDFLDRVRRLAALPAGEPRIAVPPAGRQGAEWLDDDRLAVPGFVGELRMLAGARGVDRVLPVRGDAAVHRLARAAGLDGPPGAAADPAEQDGGLVGTPSQFRAVAGGTATPIPEGRVCAGPREAEDFVWRLLCGGRSALVRTGRGSEPGAADELIVPVGGRPGADAGTTVAIGDRETLAEYLDKNWRRYRGDEASPVVVEHYILDCGRLHIEFLAAPEGVSVLFHGHAPAAAPRDALVIPPRPELVPDLADFIGQATQVMATVRDLGHIGYGSLDAALTPSGRVLFTGLTCGLSAATHLDAVARLAVGTDYLDTRVLIVRDRVRWSALGAAEEVLAREGLGFDPRTRTGVLLTGDDLGAALGAGDGAVGGVRGPAGVFGPAGPSGQFLAVGRDHAHAGELEAGALTALGAAAPAG